jgi:vesicle-associated membrane protein 7
MRVIDYSAVVRGHTIIASIGDLTGLSEREILRLLPPNSSRTEQKITSGKLFSFLITPGLTFVCVSPQSVDKQRPLTFLDILSRRWAAAYGSVSASAADHALDQVYNTSFGPLFEDYGRASKTAEIARDLAETQDILTESMSKALDRGAELESMSSKSESLLTTSEDFRAQATGLKWKMRCEYVKSWVFWILVVVVAVYLGLAWWCDGLMLGGCLRKK